MESIGFSSSEVDQIITLLAAILHIGDIEFVSSEEGGGDSATVRNPEVVETVSQLLCLESSAEVSFALTTLRTVTRGEPVDKLYSCSKAAVVRDAAAKALYSRMFQWIVSRINTHLQPRDNYSRSKLSVTEDHLNIGILDIFGFENFEANSFEQFCINLANEQLQQYFNHQIFAMEKLECAKEGVDDLDISYTDNTPVIDLFLARPIGLLCLLDEQCKGLNGSEKAFVQRSRESFNKHQCFAPHRGNALEFTISHYAGDVTYEIEGFIEKNRDSLPEPVADALRFTSLQLL
ncbi:Myosin-IIIb, partial [Geodia barretti]